MLDIVYGLMLLRIDISTNLGSPNSCATCLRPTFTHSFEWHLWKRQVRKCYARFASEVTTGPGHLPPLTKGSLSIRMSKFPTRICSKPDGNQRLKVPIAVIRESPDQPFTAFVPDAKALTLRFRITNHGKPDPGNISENRLP